MRAGRVGQAGAQAVGQLSDALLPPARADVLVELDRGVEAVEQ